MEHAEQILVVILSSFLAIFLILSIIVLVLVIRVVLVVKRVSLKAEHLADKAEAVSEFVQHAATPMLIGRLFSNLSDKFFKSSTKTKRK